ncbi:MAG: NAD(P)(+) transhydrogenase (Re/Si-specific) subunit beta [candidate division Zixibacteria bacterium]|nr:NAD(P)(+) transhydrogenase (Re/Si-specific) subunit beta [candidate division Zixibacteria bacterium]
MSAKVLSDLAYLTSAFLFIIGLKFLSHPAKARRGNFLAILGMAFALVATFIFLWSGPSTPLRASGGTPERGMLIIAGIVIGGLLGTVGARFVAITNMPQMVALLNGCGGGAAALISTVEFVGGKATGGVGIGSAVFGGVVGSLAFWGCLVAFGKLQGWMERAITSTFQKIFNFLLLAAILGVIVWVALGGGAAGFYTLLILAFLLGILMVIPIGGADMPVVISLLNSFTGLAVAATGFALKQPALIISGTLVGASGTLLTLLMCRAMNRPLTNVLFAGVGAGPVAAPGAVVAGAAKTAREISPEDAAVLLGNIQSLIIIPGYGMAVAQAQHIVRELADMLANKGVEVKYAVHPVAGRMPGHMNVLLAEANVPYDQLFDLDQINPDFERCDVALVIGANDVVNPAARTDQASPIYGMPILDADHAKHIIVIKRSLRPGFAGIDNELYYDPKTYMLFGDAKGAVAKLVEALKAA